MKTLKISLFVVSIAVIFAGCVGPEGPQGPQGPSGVTGTYGTDISNPADWQASISAPDTFLVAGYNVTFIDQYADANGVIMVYYQTSSMSSTQWSPLPDTYPISPTVQQTFTFTYDIGNVTLQLENSNGSKPATPPAFNFKVVVIPTAVIKQHPGLNIKDYQMVSQVLRLDTK
jgi:hypothetical protein